LVAHIHIYVIVSQEIYISTAGTGFHNLAKENLSVFTLTTKTFHVRWCAEYKGEKDLIRDLQNKLTWECVT